MPLKIRVEPLSAVRACYQQRVEQDSGISVFRSRRLCQQARVQCKRRLGHRPLAEIFAYSRPCRPAHCGFRNVVPFRRTAITFDPPAGSDIKTWPMTFDVTETFYFKPEVGRIMVSPVDMEPSEPCDAQADELETAMAIDRLHTFTPWRSGLAGQGGNGVMGSAAAARLAASLDRFLAE